MSSDRHLAQNAAGSGSLPQRSVSGHTDKLGAGPEVAP